MQPYTVWIEAEAWEDGWDPLDSNSDVIVDLPNGTRWVASFFTYTNVTTLVDRRKESGECLHGAYFWSSDMILIDELSRTRIEEVIADLKGSGWFERIFTQMHVDDFSQIPLEGF